MSQSESTGPYGEDFIHISGLLRIRPGVAGMSGTLGRSSSKSKGKAENGQSKTDGGTMSFVGSGHVTASGMLAGGLGPMMQHPVNLNLSLSALSNGKISKASLSATNAAGVATTLDMSHGQHRSGSISSSKSQQQQVLDLSSAAQRQAAQLTMKKNLQRSGSMQLQGSQGQQPMQQGQASVIVLQQQAAQQQALQRSQNGQKKATQSMQGMQAQQSYAQQSSQQQSFQQGSQQGSMQQKAVSQSYGQPSGMAALLSQQQGQQGQLMQQGYQANAQALSGSKSMGKVSNIQTPEPCIDASVAV